MFGISQCRSLASLGRAVYRSRKQTDMEIKLGPIGSRLHRSDTTAMAALRIWASVSSRCLSRCSGD